MEHLDYSHPQPCPRLPRWAFRLILLSPILLSVVTGAFLFHRGFHPEGNRTTCHQNLREIGVALGFYAQANRGHFPSTLNDLVLTTDVSSDLFVCPSSNDVRSTGATLQEVAQGMTVPGHLSYLYVGAGLTTDIPAATVLVYEPLSNHAGKGMNVLFADGHVDFLEPTAARRLMQDLSMGRNPPPAIASGNSADTSRAILISTGVVTLSVFLAGVFLMIRPRVKRAKMQRRVVEQIFTK